ncbi:hypothetical protein [Thermocoleostomius sinensis]|uniref:Uncharacterized protein n=1 Tax=Thermocoleostomius sinensis A174 TaxID=2016057 RepID=A0A9E9C8C5_9CYAN|nr:hypothetical protein [Thermocoleostomius sinensis]WAL60168.1 hypothetical protein OXH18_23870 [Thermocoleostomius sinensis A174]
MKLMQVWIVCCLAFFGAAELYQWLQGVTLPMPVFVITGALLAVASNANKVLPKQTQWQAMPPAAPPKSTPAIDQPSAHPAFPPPTVAPPRHYPGVQLPNFTSPAPRSISFTIEKAQPLSEEPNLGE